MAITEWADKDRAPDHEQVIWQEVPGVIGWALWGILRHHPDFTVYAVAGLYGDATVTYAGTKASPLIHMSTDKETKVTTIRVAVAVVNPEPDEDAQ